MFTSARTPTPWALPGQVVVRPAGSTTATTHGNGRRGAGLLLAHALVLAGLWLAPAPPALAAGPETTTERPSDVAATRGRIDLNITPPRAPRGFAATPPPPSAQTTSTEVQAQPPKAPEANAATAREPEAKVPVAKPTPPTPAVAATEPPARKSAPPARSTAKAPPPSVDESLAPLAQKLVEAMARANARQKLMNPPPRSEVISTAPAPTRPHTPTPAAPGNAPAESEPPTDTGSDNPEPSNASRQYIRERAAELAGFPAPVAVMSPTPAPKPMPRSAAPPKPKVPGEWSYEGETGPEHWHTLDPRNALCASGQRQSPIALDSTTTLQGPAEPLGLDYRASSGVVKHTGHSLEVQLEPGNSLAVRGNRYALKQVHFHHPAETVVNGVRHPMSAHLVHQSAAGEWAVLSVLLVVGEGNAAVDTAWTYLPLDKNDTVPLPAPLFNPGALIPRDLRYFQFLGSLTTPPCTEDVLWLVMKQPVTISPAQLRLYRQLFPNTARPTQAINGRPVREAM